MKDPGEEFEMAEADGYWLEANVTWWFFDEHYPRGYIPDIVNLADWLRRNVPNGEVWYGPDEPGPGDMKPFTPELRKHLMDFYQATNGGTLTDDGTSVRWERPD